MHYDDSVLEKIVKDCDGIDDIIRFVVIFEYNLSRFPYYDLTRENSYNLILDEVKQIKENKIDLATFIKTRAKFHH